MTNVSDPHGAFYNGVTEDDIEDAMEIALGDILRSIPGSYKKYGPPPVEAYFQSVSHAFAVGYGWGYRRAHVDCTLRGPR